MTTASGVEEGRAGVPGRAGAGGGMRSAGRRGRGRGGAWRRGRRGGEGAARGAGPGGGSPRRSSIEMACEDPPGNEGLRVCLTGCGCGCGCGCVVAWLLISKKLNGRYRKISTMAAIGSVVNKVLRSGSRGRGQVPPAARVLWGPQGDAGGKGEGSARCARGSGAQLVVRRR